MQGAALSREYTKEEVIRNGVTSHGVRFDIKQLDPARVRFLTSEEVEEIKEITDADSTISAKRACLELPREQRWSTLELAPHRSLSICSRSAGE